MERICQGLTILKRCRNHRWKSSVSISSAWFKSNVSGPASRSFLRFNSNEATNPKGTYPDRKVFTVKKNSSNLQPERKDFGSLGISNEVLNSLKLSYPDIQLPSPIQETAIPAVLNKKNPSVIIAAQTGTGKTFSYLLPLAQILREEETLFKMTTRRSRPRALILLPNRELCDQVLEVAKQLCHHAKLRAVGLTGGNSYSADNAKIKDGVDILVATPGRLLQYQEQEKLYFTDIRHVVVDEADAMIEKGFGEDLEKLFLPIKGRKDTLPTYYFPTRFIFVTATLPDSVRTKLQKMFPGIKEIATHSLHRSVETLKHEFIKVSNNKHEILDSTLSSLQSPQRILVFCNTVPSCRSTDHFLSEQDYKSTSYHGDIPSKTRDANWRAFVAGDKPILVCTDAASRGLDTTMVDHVIMFDFPTTVVDYLHRVGRTARAGRKGKAISFVAKRDRFLADAIQNAINKGESLEELVAKMRLRSAQQPPTQEEVGDHRTVQPWKASQSSSTSRSNPPPKKEFAKPRDLKKGNR
eukprot:TRINITY_DN6890_c0_g1_i1.p1 TRINITY_DN6890_c0_g1~~TRINITY_DN6890_c0_g1_i1.p1  ORF type:complete len:524 (-),score=47.96 TRINITY_DN6890_c0_g1_i1:22-1593(-)